MSEETDNNKPDASQAGSGQDSEADKSAKPDKQKTPESAPGKSAIEKSKAQASSSDKQKAQAKHATTQHKRHSPTHKSSGWGLVVIVVLGLLAVAGWYGLTEVQQTQQTFSELQQSQQALTSQNRDFEAAMSARMERLQAQQKELTDYIQVLRDKNQHLRKDWLLMEAEYLIQLANYRLLFERDINTAIAALDSADTRLRETGDPGVLAVRQVIAEAVQALKQVPQADLAGLSLSLTALNNDIEKLPLATPDPKSKQQEQEQTESQTKKVESWSDLPAAIWSDLKNLVEIRDHEAPIQPLLTPKERFFLIENLRLQIEQARLAMLSGQAEVFQERLATAISWIQQHFDKESSITQAALDTLKQVQAESIAPALPDISTTHQALRNYRLGNESEKKPQTEQPEQSTDQNSPVPEPAGDQPPASDAGAS